MDIAEGISRMRNEFFAFQAEHAAAYQKISQTFDESEKCGLQEIDVVNIANVFMAIPKNSIYKKVVAIR